MVPFSTETIRSSDNKSSHQYLIQQYIQNLFCPPQFGQTGIAHRRYRSTFYQRQDWRKQSRALRRKRDESKRLKQCVTIFRFQSQTEISAFRIRSRLSLGSFMKTIPRTLDLTHPPRQSNHRPKFSP